MTLVAVLFVHAVLLPVIITGAVLLGLVYTRLAGGAGRGGHPAPGTRSAAVSVTSDSR